MCRPLSQTGRHRHRENKKDLPQDSFLQEEEDMHLPEKMEEKENAAESENRV